MHGNLDINNFCVVVHYKYYCSDLVLLFRYCCNLTRNFIFASKKQVCRLFSDADAPNRRIGKPLIFCRTESDSPMENGYARPVEGIHVVVDMQNNVVIEFEDRKLVPLPPPDHLRNYTPGETRGGVDRSDVKPLIINQPEGPSFRINGYFVEWQKVKCLSSVDFVY